MKCSGSLFYTELYKHAGNVIHYKTVLSFFFFFPDGTCALTDDWGLVGRGVVKSCVVTPSFSPLTPWSSSTKFQFDVVSCSSWKCWVHHHDMTKSLYSLSFYKFHNKQCSQGSSDCLVYLNNLLLLITNI